MKYDQGISEVEKILSEKKDYDFIESLIYDVAPQWPLNDIDINSLSKRCLKCTTSENDPSATPFVDGICQYCQETDTPFFAAIPGHQKKVV